MSATTQLLKGLNPKQIEAVTNTDGPLLIIASAGSGKTRVIAHRVAYLINKKRVTPRNILAVTFTNKAAQEMKERIYRMLPKSINQDMWISTFHSFGRNILKEHGEKIGLSKKFTIFDENDQLGVIMDCMEELNINKNSLPPELVRKTINNLKEQLITPDEYEKTAESSFEEKIAQIYRLYQNKLDENNIVDFPDLISKPIMLLKKHKKVLEEYQTRFKYIMVDEYQDTNYSQHVLVKLLSKKHNNICVVGDEDQSIYSFRGACIHNILNFHKENKNTTIVKMEENYRSTKKIVEIANKLIKNNELRLGKTLYTNNKPGEDVTYFNAKNEQDEAYFIVKEIKKLIKENLKYKDFAILYRTHFQSKVLEEVMIKSNIPYRIIGGIGFYERKEIKDIISYLRVVYNPNDSISLKRIINIPHREIGIFTINKLQNFSKKYNKPLFEVLNTKGYLDTLRTSLKEKVEKFYSTIKSIIEEKNTSLYNLVKLILDKINYIEWLQKEYKDDAKIRIENVKELQTIIKSFEKENSNLSIDAKLSEFLNRVTLIQQIDKFDEKENLVTLMTLHNAKGLEFRVVFLTGLEEGIFPYREALQDKEELEEERRLCYVGITRAKERLYISRAASRNWYGRVTYNPVSQFVKELGLEEETEIVKKPTILQRGEVKSCKVNDKIYHQMWGEGKVISVEGKGEDVIIEVNFKNAGIKKLMLKYAPIEKT